MFDLMPFRNRSHSRNDVANWEDSMNSLVSDFFNDMMDLADVGFKTDIKEDEDNYYIEAELPGLNKEDINIELNNDHLVISATNEETKEEEEENYIRRERRAGSYQRAFALDNVNEDEIEAEYDEGLLKVTLPKEESGQPQKRVIDIE